MAEHTGRGNVLLPELKQGVWSRGRPSLGWVVATALSGSALWLTWRPVRRGIWVDFDVYVAGARAIVDRSDLYAVSVHGLPFTYPPFAAMAFVPLARLSDVEAHLAFTVVTLAALATILEVLRRRLALSPLQVLPVVLVVLALEPLRRTVLLGQVNAVLIALVVLDCFVVPRRHRGWLIGIAMGIKLTPAVFLVWLVLRREWGAVLRAGAAGALTVAVGMLVAPSASWFYWRGGFADLGRFGAVAELATDNQSLSAAIARLVGLTAVPAGLVLVSGVIAVGAGAWVAGRCLRRGDDVGALLAVAMGGLLASPISWSHHWLWMAAVLLWAVAERRRAWGAVIAAVFWFGPSWAVYRKVPDPAPYPPADRLVSTAYVVLGLITLVLMARGGAEARAHPTPVAGASDRGRDLTAEHEPLPSHD